MIWCWCRKKKGKSYEGKDDAVMSPTLAVTTNTTTTEMMGPSAEQGGQPVSPNPLDCLNDDMDLGATIKGVALGDTVVLGDSGEVAVLVEDLGEELCPRYCVRNADGESKWVASVVLADLQDIIPDETVVPVIQTSPTRRSVRIRLDETISTPGDFHKAPVGAAVHVLVHGEWTHAVVTELHSDGTSDIVWQSGAVQYKVRPDLIRVTNSDHSQNCLQGRWYDGSGAIYDVVELNVKSVRPSGMTTLSTLQSRNGMILHNGIKSYRINSEMVVWAEGSVWRRVRGNYVTFSVNDLSVQWGQSPLGLMVQANNGSADVTVGQILHSVDDKSIMTLDQFTRYVVQTNKQVIRLLMCKAAPHPPVPAPYFDTSSLNANEEVVALWGGMYHPCSILGKAANDGYVIRWQFDNSNWTALPLALKGRTDVNDPRARQVAECWIKGKRLFNILVKQYTDPSSSQNGTYQSVVKMADLICALRLSRANAKAYLKHLSGDTVTLTDWLMWIGKLCELSVAPPYLEWVDSHITTSNPLPPPEFLLKSRYIDYEPCDAYPSLTPPVEDCVLIEPGRGRVVGESGSVARRGETFDTEEVGTLAPGTLVDVVEVKGRRAKVVAPLVGWVSLITADGITLVAEARPPVTVDEEYLLKEHKAPLGCTFDDCVLVNVDSTGPAKRSQLERFIGRKLEHVNEVRVATDTDIQRKSRSPTVVNLKFKPVKHEVKELRKRHDEATGLIFTDTALTGVAPMSAAERCGFSDYVGRYLLSIDGDVLREEPDVDLLCFGVTTVQFVFREVLSTDPTAPLVDLMEEADSDSDTAPSPVASPTSKSPHTPF